MKRIILILLGDPQTQNIGGGTNYADPSSTVQTLSAIRDVVYPNKAKYQIPQSNIENSPAYQQAIRFASPDLNSKDYYPNENQSPLLGSEQSKTLGSYPLFSGASLYPADLWAKRRAAIGDYMLKLEAVKSGQQLVKTPPLPYIEGGATLGGALNQGMIEDLKDIQGDAAQRGISAADAIDNSSNPYYPKIAEKIAKYKSLGVTAKSIEENIKNVNKDFLGAGNTYSNATAQAINEYNQIASAPVNHQVSVARMDESDSHNDLQTHLNNLNYKIATIPNIPGIVDNAAKNIQQKSQQSIKSLGSNSGLDEWITNGAESAYPPEVFAKDKDGNYLKDAKGNPMLDAGAKDDFLTKQAQQIASGKQPLFKDYNKDSDPNAPFAIDDIKKGLEANLGYKLSTAVHTAAEPGAGSKNEVSAVPQYVANKISDLSTPGKEINIKKGYSITAGQGYTTFNENGVQTVVANSNRPEIVKHLISVGAIEPNQMGAVDAASAQINANSNPALWKEIGKYTSNTERPEIKETDSPITNFNNRINALSGGAGISIDGTDNKVQKATIAKKGTDDFFLDINNKDEGKTQGVIIPNGTITTMFKEPGWTSKVASAVGASGIAEWLKNDKKAYVSGAGDGFAMGDVYYHKEQPDANGITYYTVYDKKTDKPHQVDVKQPGGGTAQQQIHVPSYQIDNMLNVPKKLLDDAKSTEQDISSPTGGASVQKNIATKTAKGQSATPQTGAVSDNDTKAAQYILSQKWAKTPEEANEMVNQYKTTTDTKQKNNWNVIQQRIKGK